jgi:energy-coupling factor transport system substrate-specific component
VSGATLVLSIAACLALVGVVALERGPSGPKELALVATLGAAAAAGRVLFAPIPSVKPVTMICVVTGATLGARAGMAVGALAALVSNAFLGQGPWTPPQMLLWGLAGISGALLRPLTLRVWGMALVTLLWGFAFGWAMNLWSLSVYGPEVSWDAFVATSARSLWFDTAAAAGNVLFTLIAGAALARLLSRYAARIRTDIAWEEGSPGRAGP